MMTEVFSSGGGTQSAAICALIIQGRLPRPDFVVIADTGRERQTTWDYLDAVIRPQLAKVDLKVHRIGPEWSSVPTHGKNYLSHNGNSLLLPAFSSQSEPRSKLPGFCSNRWKAETIARFLSKELGVKPRFARSWIGFSLDESRRALNLMGTADYAAGKYRLPLIHDVPLRRQAAIREVERMGWPTPPRSACWMCPNQSDGEWAALKRDSPGEFEAACLLEEEVRQVDPFAWFHTSCVSLAKVDFSPQADLFGEPCGSGHCFL